ncbi:MAG: glycosyl hydrolase [Allomuricauda sp.]
MKKGFLLLCALYGTLAFAQTANEYFKPLKFRSIGPFRGGRSVTASGVVGSPQTYYMGSTGGGLWKTTNAGSRWDNISDGFFEMGSVGAVSVSRSNPNIVYCGMGEHAPRGVMTSYGDGVYRSNDAGKNWIKLGLEKTQHISRIIIHPTNPDIVYVAAQGALFAPNKERGVYRSMDGGKTWKNILFVNESTGAAELSMDMNNPLVLYAAMWEHQRKPNIVISGGEGSGLYKSTDGGDTWTELEEGLPKEKGKMAIAVSPANSQKVYAVIESDSNADKGGLFVSDDAGKSWSMASGDNRLVQRAWYYIEVFADPNDEDTVYVMSAEMFRSEDGGKTWKTISVPHGDTHDLWISPNDSKNMIMADDGGATITFDYGENWTLPENMPTAQFYRINTDNLFPYNIYAGQQDNSSVKIASLSVGRWSIGREDWHYSAGGESAFLAFDPDNPHYVMGGSYLGTIELLDSESKMATDVMAAPIQYLGREARDMKYLYNWNAPIIWSKHEPGTFYHGAQLVLRTRDNGVTWEEISPDLTRNQDDKQGNGGGPYTNEAVGAENYGTLAYIMESPHEKGVLYTGSDDGLVHVTKNGGQSWENITPKGLAECLINAIEVSPHDPATVYIATTRYKFNDYTPALYKSTDYGKSWANISAGIPYGAFTRVVREDQKRKGLLYAGTETGLYISWNDGKNWEPLQLNLPRAPITDLKVHQGDLIVATSGRSFWILDDITTLSQYKANSDKLELYRPEDAVNGFWFSPLSSSSKKVESTNPYEGVNPANGMVIHYNLPKAMDSTEIALEVLDNQGKILRSYSSKSDEGYVPHNGGGPPPAPVLGTDKGLNRFVWDLKTAIIPGIPNVYMEADFTGHKVPPGSYTLRLKAGDETVSVQGTVVPTPNTDMTPARFAEHHSFMSDLETNLTDMHNKVNTLFKVQGQLKELLKDLGNEELKKEGQALLDRLKAWDGDMVQRKSQAYDDVENFPNKFTAEYLFLMNQSNSALPRINQASKDRKKELDAQWAGLKQRAETLMKSDIPNFNKKLWENGVGAIRM